MRVRTVIALAALVLSTSGCAWIARVSESGDGQPADADAPFFSAPAISADGGVVAFDSAAGSLVAAAPDGGVFARDTRSGTTEAISVRADGTVDDFADTPAISGNGRFVAFVSDDRNLVPDGNGNFTQVFLRDRVSRTTTRVSSKPNGNQGTDDSGSPALSADGLHIAFESDSGGLVTGDTNDSTDVFVRNRLTGVIQRVSVDAAGNELDSGGDEPSISADGRFVAFTTFEPLVFADGNNTGDVYVRDRLANTVRLASATSVGTAGNLSSFSGRVSASGRFVAFLSWATNLDGIADTNEAPDVFVRDLATGTTSRVSRSAAGGLAHGSASEPGISGDGRFVTYASTAPDAVADDTNGVLDTFVFDRATSETSRTSTDQLGTQLPNGGSAPAISADGRSALFATSSPITGPSPSTGVQLYVRLTVPGVAPR